MSLPVSTSAALTPEAFGRWGRAVLVGGLVLGLALVLFMAWAAPAALPLLPGVLLAGVAGWALFRRPVLNLYLVLAAFVLIIGYEEGLQVEEVFYGLYFLAFLASWFILFYGLYRIRMVRTVEDAALLLFLFYAAASVTWGLGFGASFRLIFGEGLVLAMLLFYFPVKEVCARRPEAVWVLLLIVAWFALFTTVRNLMYYQQALSSATQLWQIATGRVAKNEVLLMMPSLVALVLLLYARRWPHRLLLMAGFLFSFVGLIITQSRGYWAAFLFGGLVLFVLTDRRRKAHLALLITLGMVGFVLVGALFFPDSLTLIVAGVLDRFASLGSAVGSDISLLARYYEMKALWYEHIRWNPILGYGIGRPYQYHSFVLEVDIIWSFVHNAYIGLWYKYGLVGMGLVLFFWGRSIWLGVRLFRQASAPRMIRLVGLVVAVCLLAELPVAATSNPFLISDGTLMIGLLAGLGAGCAERVKGAPAAEA